MTSLMRILFLPLLISAPLLAQEVLPSAPISLAELASKADLIMLAQVKDTDYFLPARVPGQRQRLSQAL